MPGMTESQRPKVNGVRPGPHLHGSHRPDCRSGARRSGAADSTIPPGDTHRRRSNRCLLDATPGIGHDDVFLVGPQHFALSIAEVRDKLTEISGMRDVIARDLWDAQQSAHAQVIDLEAGNDTAMQLGSLLLTASLSTAVNAVKGLTREEMVECLVSPLREPSEFLGAFEALEKLAWYLHHTPENRFYFDRQENLTKLLQSLANDAPENQIDDLIRHRLREMFKATRKTAYEDVLPLPPLGEVAERVRRGRVLVIVSPDSRVPPEEVQRFFDGLDRKNNLCVLTGDKTAMGSVEKAARQLYAAQKADGRIPEGHPQRDELERKQAAWEQDFNATVLGLFDKVLFTGPFRRPREHAELAWAAERASEEELPVIGSKWAALRPEERWWLFMMTVAEAGLPDDHQRGWRRALHLALADGEAPVLWRICFR